MTSVDQMFALQYAINRLNKELCESGDQSLLAKICKNGVNCLKWKDDDSLRLWPHICKVDTARPCLSDEACGKSETCNSNPDDPLDSNKYCGFCTLKEKAGRCQFSDKESCLYNSQIPYKCNPDGCDDSSNVTKPYLEWRDDSNKCILGNVILKQYAEHPMARPNLTEKNKANIPPAFRYDDKVGKMYVTYDYCKHYGVEYGSGACKTNADCNQNGRSGGTCHGSMDSDSSIANPKICDNFNCSTDADCISPDVCVGGKCNGISSNCWTTTGEVVGEMLVGRTIFNDFRGVPCNPVYESFINKVVEVSKQSPDYILRLADGRYMKDKKVIGKDFAGKGINMYLIEWKPDSGNINMIETGYDADEVSKVYPHLVIVKDNKKYINILKNQISNDKNIKRLFLSLNSSKWLMENISFAYKNFK